MNALAQAEAEVVRAFIDADALSLAKAKPLDEMRIAHDATLASLVERGTVRRSPSDADKYYMALLAPSLITSREQRRTVVAALRAVIAIAVGLFIWRIIELL